MSNHKPSMLIFGAEGASRTRSMPAGMAGSSRAFVEEAAAGPSRVSVEVVASNLRTVIDQVDDLIRAAQEPAGALGVAHVDVNLAIGADGSVGLLGTAGGTSAKATLTLRLAPRTSTQGAGQGRSKPPTFAMNDDGALRMQALT